MKQRVLSALLAVVVAISLSAPVFGTRTGSTAASGSSGNTKCTVRCSTIAGEMGSCSCFDEGDWCYYISVNG